MKITNAKGLASVLNGYASDWSCEDIKVMYQNNAWGITTPGNFVITADPDDVLMAVIDHYSA